MSNAFQRQDVKYNKLKNEFREFKIGFGKLEEEKNELKGKINRIVLSDFLLAGVTYIPGQKAMLKVQLMFLSILV